ncbi:hypothetical protein LIER_03214 [Lithospermum erythrorhizon]|uniref:Uncharacterized protein n=1 Tax=Lithospermum erythrorhizon TaxID=34254 RepID=A0AAV3NT43_LITER
MSASDGTGTVKIAAIDSLVGTGTVKIAAIDNIRSDFNERISLLLLRRGFGKHNEGQRKMLLLGYFDDIDSKTGRQSASNTSSLLPTENTEKSSDKGKQPTSHSSPLSPLKCQMSKISINPELSS